MILSFAFTADAFFFSNKILIVVLVVCSMIGGYIWLALESEILLIYYTNPNGIDPLLANTISIKESLFANASNFWAEMISPVTGIEIVPVNPKSPISTVPHLSFK